MSTVNFTHLPTELRRQIWEYTLESRLIQLHCTAAVLNGQYLPPCIYQLLTTGAKLGREPITYAIYLTAYRREIRPLPALSVCFESRDVALSIGYRSWKIPTDRGKVIDLMWNPKLDTVFVYRYPEEESAARGIRSWNDRIMSLTGDSVGHLAYNAAYPSPLRVFEKQFPIEITEVRYLAIPTTHWAEGEHNYVESIWPLIDFTSVWELAVVLVNSYERQCVERLTGPRSLAERGPWNLPADLETNLDILRAYYEKLGPEYHPLGRKPRVRVVSGVGKIVSEEDMQLVLRCHPCPYYPEMGGS